MDGVFLPRPGEPSGEWPVLPGSSSGEVVVLRQRLGVDALRLVRTARTLVLLPVESITAEKNSADWVRICLWYRWPPTFEPRQLRLNRVSVLL